MEKEGKTPSVLMKSVAKLQIKISSQSPSSLRHRSGTERTLYRETCGSFLAKQSALATSHHRVFTLQRAKVGSLSAMMDTTVQTREHTRVL